MLRHACGYALANKGHDTRALQAYLGHKNIQHTVRYTELSPTGSRTFGAVDGKFEAGTKVTKREGPMTLMKPSSGSPPLTFASRYTILYRTTRAQRCGSRP